MLGGINSERAIVKMRWLETIGKIQPNRINTWNKMRNTKVHASLKSDAGFCILSLQEKINALNTVQTLFYEIKFSQIGYHG